MSEELTLGFGSIRFVLRSREPWLGALVQERYPGFVGRPEGPASRGVLPPVSLRLRTALDRPGAGATRYAVSRPGEGSSIAIRSGLLEGRLDTSSRSGEVGVLDQGHPELGSVAPGQALENYLRIATAILAADAGAALVHGAALVRRDGATAVLCCGPSGAGKSTLARLAAENHHRVLGDDLALIEMGEGGDAVIWATPFWGDHPPPPRPLDSFPLSGIFELHQAPRHVCDRLGTGEALGCLLASIPFQGFLTREQVMRLVELGERLVACLPAHRLSFTPEAGVLEVLEECLP